MHDLKGESGDVSQDSQVTVKSIIINLLKFSMH